MSTCTYGLCCCIGLISRYGSLGYGTHTRLCEMQQGLHWWTCDVTNPKAPKPVAGVVPAVFKSTSEWVHIAWVKQGTQLKFYRNGFLVSTFPNAPAEVELSDRYNIGRKLPLRSTSIAFYIAPAHIIIAYRILPMLCHLPVFNHVFHAG